jgi:uncharacterized protein (TIGR00725 family)
VKTIVGVMGAGVPLDEDAYATAYRLGRLIAEKGWVLLNGGRDCGAMDASAKGASDAGGLVVGILPDLDSRRASAHVDIAIPTGMGDARNVVNVLASHVVIALPGGAGTLSEVALALKADKTVIAVGFPLGEAFAAYYASRRLIDATGPEETIRLIEAVLRKAGRR